MAQQQFKPATPVKTSGTVRQTAKSSETNSSPVHLIFDKGNYRLLIISIAIVAFGFVLMSGTTDIYSNTKIIVAPLVILAGFALGFFAIFKKPENS